MANPTSVRQALENAPVGIQWYKPAAAGSPMAYLTKLSNGQWQAKARDGDPVKFTGIDSAIAFYNQNNLVLSNDTRWQVNAVLVAPQKTSTTTKQTASQPTSSVKKTVSSSSSSQPTTVQQPIKIKALSDEPIAGPKIDDIISSSGSATGTLPNINTGVTSIADAQDASQYNARADWRVRLALSDDPSATYLYKSPTRSILDPLKKTNGVIFPYTPNISVNYAAKYDESNLTHSNYKIYQYSNSAVESVQITGEFTAQDTHEANYLLAVIHFFRSMTKMFYGQDMSPKRGTPPPLCYLYGMGTFQFSAHPLVITGFSYNLPVDVDYIKTVSTYDPGQEQPSSVSQTQPSRLSNSGAITGGKPTPPDWSSLSSNQTGFVTWIPTRINLSITCLPVQSRNQISNKFSLNDYATGKLLNGASNTGSSGGAFW